MNYIFDKEKINQLIYDFYKSTGVAVTLYDSEEKIIATSPIFSSYCSKIRTKPECVKGCDLSNQCSFKAVAKEKKARLYTCHAGLLEIIVPVFYEGVLIAYMQMGQLKDAEGVYSSQNKILKVAEKYGFQKSELTECYENVQLVNKERLYAFFHIMDALITSFWADGLIRCQRSMLSVKIEQYLLEHLTEEIYIEELCNRFFLSKNALYKLWRHEFKTTVNAWILTQRLSLAETLLKSEKSERVANIASLCGFADYNYFIRLFKKKHGVTPLQYRKRLC